MEISKLEIGMVIKNYKGMCELLGEKIKGGGQSKQLQLKDFERFFKYHKEGQKFIIDEVYDAPIEKINNRMVVHKEFENLDIISDSYDENGVYIITFGKDIYIGSTTIGFRERFMQHRRKGNPLPTYDMLNSGAAFSVLWMADSNDTEKFIREKENYYKDSNYYNLINVKGAWSYEKSTKIKYKTIRVENSNYDKSLEILRENNLI
jgi:hypothetical protein